MNLGIQLLGVRELDVRLLGVRLLGIQLLGVQLLTQINLLISYKSKSTLFDMIGAQL